jgi:alpha-mannosidase
MEKREAECGTLDRRQFLTGVAATAVCPLAVAQTYAAKEESEREVFIVSQFHPASCGWLTTFSKERVYCANSYLTHLKRVGEDPAYNLVLSEANNIIAIMNFQPNKIAELKQRVKEKRVELVNGFFLESTINLSGGEALVRMGVEGLRWYDQIFEVRPRFAYCIDTCGVHDQMAQIVSGLGLDALIYTRRNPTDKAVYWMVSPDGSRTLTLCPGSYAECSIIFTNENPLTREQTEQLEQEFAQKQDKTPDHAPIMMLASSGDYSLAPPVKAYPSALLKDWSQRHRRKIRFTTLGDYLDAIAPEIASGKISIPTHQGGTAYDYDAFWIENSKVKTWYRTCEQQLRVSETLSTIASLHGKSVYPVQSMYDAWMLMFLNADRNTLWGSAGGMVFVDAESWDAQDRFEWVARTTAKVTSAAAESIAGEGGMSLFNPLNWKRSDPIALKLPDGKSVEGMTCEALPDGRTLCFPQIDSMALGQLKLQDKIADQPQPIFFNGMIKTSYYVLQMDLQTGAIASLRWKKSGHEIFGGLANVVIAERPKKKPDDAGDHMPAIPDRDRLATSNQYESKIEVIRGPLTTTIVTTGTFYGGAVIRRTVRLFEGHPRIEFEIELNDVPNYTVVFADFPLASDIAEVRRGVPFGFSHGAWQTPNPNLHGWTKGIVPAVRWSDYATANGGVAIFDRGLSGRELNGRTASIYLFNAEDKYWGFENEWLTGKGRHTLEFALMPWEGDWIDARVPQAAWEYNLAPTLLHGTVAETRPFLETSKNIIVESMHRDGHFVVVRFVEAFGAAGEAIVKLNLPHTNASQTDMTGRNSKPLPAGPEYRVQVSPQQIVTLHFQTKTKVAEPAAVTSWDAFVPKQKLAALHRYDVSLVGHPPFGA